jgi:hypothetical protein
MAKSNLKIFLVILATALAASPAVAGNGHGRGGDSVCEDAGLIGSAYAACHTFCEALDCDAEQHNASDRACERALARFLDLSDGEQPPCLDGGGEEPGDEPQGVACPCAFGWNDPTLLPDGWQPGSCEIYDSGEGGSSVTIYGAEESPGDVMLSASWYDGEYSWGNGAGFTCGWASSDSDTGESGWVDFNEQDLAPAEPLDETRYRNLYAVCEADLAGFLGRFDMTLDDCTVFAY